jgi:hypothetical protein
MIDLARRVMVVMTRAMLPRPPADSSVLLVVHAWERPSPHTGGWRL